MSYDREYYEEGERSGKSLYKNYRWLPELTIPLAHEIIKICKLKEDDFVLDFGCAKGFLVKALRLLHINAYGCDCSEYALANAPQDIKNFLSKEPQFILYDCIIAKDVLEHLNEEEINAFFKFAAAWSRQVFVVVPLGDGEKYIIPEMEKDKTHVQRKSLLWWKQMMESVGLYVTAKTHWGHIKEQWKHSEGHGFFLGMK